MSLAQTDEEVSNRRYEDKKRLAQGDMTPIQKAFEEKNIKVLWAHTLGFDTSVMTREQNIAISAEAARWLTQLPGHTQVMIDRIEEKYEQTKDIKISADSRYIVGLEKPADTEEQLRVIEDLQMRILIKPGHEFNALMEFQSPECVQTLMTYLDDERCIGILHHDGNVTLITPDIPNSRHAMRSLNYILGPESPDKSERVPNTFFLNVAASRQQFKNWWLSDASKKWRTPIVKTSRSHLLPGASKEPAAPSSPATAAITPGREALWPILVVLCFVALAAILGFAKLRRTPR
jgi:hypothetical protein